MALTWSHASGPSGPQTMRTQRVKIHVGVWNASFASGGSQDLVSTTFLLHPALHLKKPPLLCLQSEDNSNASLTGFLRNHQRFHPPSIAISTRVTGSSHNVNTPGFLAS